MADQPPPLDPKLEEPYDEEKYLEDKIKKLTEEIERLKSAAVPDAAQIAELEARRDGLHLILRFLTS